jgi:glycosyltransferase involved in cell wall biosynthesis
VAVNLGGTRRLMNRMILVPPAKPAVSIVLPTFNRGWTIRQAVTSILEQTFTDFELIVVDDGSTDDTHAILAPVRHRFLLLQQDHRGVSAARNRGIGAARADLIAFLDSDDYWLPSKLARQVAFFQEHPQALICQTEETWIRNGRRVNPKRRHRKPAGMIFEPSLALCLVSPSAAMIRKSLLEEAGGFDESLPACEDYDLWLRISCKYPVHLIDEALTVKRGGHADQLSRAAELDRYRIRALEKILASGCLTPSQFEAAAAMLGQKCRIYINGCKKRGKFDQAQHYEALAERFGLRE